MKVDWGLINRARSLYHYYQLLLSSQELKVRSTKTFAKIMTSLGLFITNNIGCHTKTNCEDINYKTPQD